jgi:hypothetical protein
MKYLLIAVIILSGCGTRTETVNSDHSKVFDTIAQFNPRFGDSSIVVKSYAIGNNVFDTVYYPNGDIGIRGTVYTSKELAEKLRQDSIITLLKELTSLYDRDLIKAKRIEEKIAAINKSLDKLLKK